MYANCSHSSSSSCQWFQGEHRLTLFELLFGVVEKAVESIVTTLRIKSQQMIAQQRQFFVLAQCPHIAETRPGTESVLLWQLRKLLLEPSLQRLSLDRHHIVHRNIKRRLPPT